MKIKEMEVFKKAHTLVLETYDITENFPSGEKYVLIQQMRRSASSIPTNLIEGDSRYSQKEYLYFIKVAIGSCAELNYQYELSYDLKYISKEIRDSLIDLCEELMGMLISTKKAVEGRDE